MHKKELLLSITVAAHEVFRMPPSDGLLANRSVVSKEFRLLLALACREVDSDREQEALAALDAPIDWPRFCKLTNSHKLAPLVHHHLKLRFADRFEPEQIQPITERADKVAYWSRQLLLEAVDVASMLHRHGVETVVSLKGAVLAGTAYGDIARRTFFDLDILVAPEELAKAKAAFLSEGFCRVKHPSHALNFRLRPRRLSVDLHRRLCETSRILACDPGVLQRVQSRRVDGHELVDLAPEDNLVYLCEHATTHNWGTLQEACDVAFLLQTYPNLDFEKSFTLARSAGLETQLLLGLHLSQRLMGVKLPPDLPPIIQSNRVVLGLANRVQDSLASGRTLLPSAEYIDFQLRAREHWSDRIRYIPAGAIVVFRRMRGAITRRLRFRFRPPRSA